MSGQHFTGPRDPRDDGRTDDLLGDGLDRIAAEAERSAHPLAPADVRRLGDQRRRRRTLGAAAALVAAAVLVVGGVLGVSTLRTDPTPDPATTPTAATPPPTSSSPSPTRSRTPTPTPTRTPTRAATSSSTPTRTPTPSATPTASPSSSTQQPLTEASLPRASDLAWHRFGDWTPTSTWTGSGQATVNRCQLDTFESLGADQVYVREYKMGSDYASAVVLQFGSEAEFEAGGEGLEHWFATCPSRLKKQGAHGVSMDSHAVGTTGRFSEVSFISSDNPDESIFLASGVTADTASLRMALVTMETHGKDNNWDYEPNGPVGAMHPMFRTLPKVAERLG